MKIKARSSFIKDRLLFYSHQFNNPELFCKIFLRLVADTVKTDDIKRIANIVFIGDWLAFGKFMSRIKRYQIDSLLESNIWYDFSRNTAGLIAPTPKGFLIFHNVEYCREKAYYISNFFKKEKRDEQEEHYIRFYHGQLSRYFLDEAKLRNALFWTNIIHELRHIRHYSLTWEDIKSLKGYTDEEESDYLRASYEEKDAEEFAVKVFFQTIDRLNDFIVI